MNPSQPIELDQPGRSNDRVSHESEINDVGKQPSPLTGLASDPSAACHSAHSFVSDDSRDQQVMTPEQSELLRILEREAFLYFVHETNPANGLVRDKSLAG